MIYPNLAYEKRLWKKGFKYVGGADEVGRGCLAGPVVCGVVVFSKDITKRLKHPSTSSGQALKNKKIDIKINDSKKLTPKQRAIADKWIRANCLTWGIGTATVGEINKKGIVRATASGFRRAIYSANKRLKSRVDFILFDAFYIPYIRGIRLPLKSVQLKNKKTKKLNNLKLNGNQLAIINGDEKTISIGAASIIAKVFRDKLMLSLGVKYERYGWVRNKGYGTKEHVIALKKYGITKHHRKLFVRKIL